MDHRKYPMRQSVCTSDHYPSRTLGALHDQKANCRGFGHFDKAKALEAESGGLSHETSRCFHLSREL